MQKSKRNQNVYTLNDYRIAEEEEPRVFADAELELEADNIGKVHTRKHRSETEYLPGYGVTNFGLSAYEPPRIVTLPRVLATAGIISLIAVWALRKKIRTVADYAVLLNAARS